jgi:paraquat-inducible protein B
MSRRADPKLIGLFVLGAAVLLVGAVAVFGSGKLFTSTEKYVLFFQEDLAGLNVGAPVTFRGVRVGSVTDVVIRYNSRTGSVSIPVYIEVDPSKVLISGDGAVEPPEALISRGLRATLRTQSIITGLLAIDLDFEPGTPAHIVGAVTEYPEIPTVPSSISQLRTTFTTLAAQIQKLPLQSMVQDVSSSAHNLDKLIGDADTLVTMLNGRLGQTTDRLPGVLDNLNAAAKGVSQLTSNLNQSVPEIRAGTLQALDRLNAALAQVQNAAGGLQNAVGTNSPLQAQLAKTLADVSDAANSFRLLAEYLNQNPNAIVTGKGAETPR